MPQLVSEKFNVAWFKLAEFVTRKEKERALALYRLLVHSVLDTALILQLEGDLLLSFKDEKAIELYKRAALLYEESGRYLEAVLLYQHCLKVTSQHVELLEKIFQLYSKLKDDAKKVRTAIHLIKLLVERKESNKIRDFFAQITLPPLSLALVHEAYLVSLLQREKYCEQEMHAHLQALLQIFLDENEDKRLTAFLAQLALLDAEAYVAAQTILQK